MYSTNSRNFTHTCPNSADGAVSVERILRLFNFSIITLLIFSLAAVAFAPAAFARQIDREETFGSGGASACRQFRGKIIDARTLDPVAGVTVSIRCFDEDALETKTEADGTYFINEVPYGIYKVKVEKDGYIGDTTKINISQSYVRYETAIESVRDRDNRTKSDFEEEEAPAKDAKKGKVIVTELPEFLPKNNLYGETGLLELPDTGVMSENHYRVGYGVMRSRRMKSVGGAYRESNYATSFSYGLSRNFEANVFALQNFSQVPANSPFFMDMTGISVKYSNEINYRSAEKKYPYSVLYKHTNDGTDEISVPVEIATGYSKIYLIPSYKTHGGRVQYHLAYHQPLFEDHRKGSFMAELIQDDKSRWNIMNGGFRFEFKNDSAINLFLLTDQTVKKYMTTGISGTMLFR